MNFIEANAVGKRYGSTGALRERTLAIPGGTWPLWSVRTEPARPPC